LNQYTQRDVPGAADITGIAHPSSSVSVNAQSVYRRGEYYHKELALDNASAPVWQSVTNQAIYSSQTNIALGSLLLPKTPQTFWYDSDGNTSSDFVWTNSWDGENRMASMEDTAAVPSTGRTKEIWSFDAEGRWVQRIIHAWSGSAYAPQATNRFLWDGKLLVAILDHASSRVMSFMRGIDITGSFQKGGGVGGLAVIDNAAAGVHFCAYDGSGNVTALVDASGALSGMYEFSPFGDQLRATGVAAKTNPIRFGTQFANDIAGTVKYLYRDYTPSSGRWPNRDPIHEPGFGLFARRNLHRESTGENLYRFVVNDSINRTDAFGLCDISLGCNPTVLVGTHCGVIAPDGTEFQMSEHDGSGRELDDSGPSGSSGSGLGLRHGPPDPNDTNYSVTCDRSCYDVQVCLQNYHDTADVPPYFIFGPNSNTYAHNMLDECGCTVDPIPFTILRCPREGGPINTTTTTPPGAVGW
jgi:RHS repeat-associated protein